MRRSPAAAGNDLTDVHHPELPHGIIQMAQHPKARLTATEEIARLLGEKIERGRGAFRLAVPPRPR